MIVGCGVQAGARPTNIKWAWSFELVVRIARNGNIEAPDTIARESVLGMSVEVGCNVWGSSRVDRIERAGSLTLVVLLACL